MNRLRIVILVVFVLSIGLLHFFTPGHLMLNHAIYRRFSYIPIALGGIWFGLRGGLLVATATSFAFIPHLLLYFGQGPDMYMGEVMEVFLYLAAGSVIGLFAGREASLRERYKGLAEKLEASYDKLHRETELLVEAEQQLAASQKFSALGQLSASLAHEIKNPLASIRGTAEIFRDAFPMDHPKREFADILLKEAARLNATVDDVLRYSRGQKQLPGKKESLAEVLRRVEKLVATHIRKKHIRFQMSGVDSVEEYQVEGDKMSQVFLNVLLNSVEALPDNGVIEVTVKKTTDGVSLEMSDNGPGIPPEERDRIFSPFVSGKDGGTGLGLSISKKIMESYGGSIRYKERPSGGASFTLYLP